MKSETRGASWSRGAVPVLGVLLAFGALFLPPLVRGEVLYPHSNAVEVGAEQGRHDALSRIFADQCTLYVPEIRAHLAGEHQGWIATWNRHNELGRPLAPSGFGSAYPLGHLLSRLTRDAYVYNTWMTLIALLATALFALRFLHALGLAPLACLVGALGISVGPIFGAAQVLPSIQWGYCWTFGALLGIECWLRRPGPRAWIAIAFCVYSVLMTGFPQHVLALGWMVAAWLVLRLFEQLATARARLRALAWIGAATLTGVLATLPMYTDMYLEWRRSARADYVTMTQAVCESGRMSARLWVALTSVLWDGEPGFETYSLGPFYAGLAAVALVAPRRRHVVVWAGAAAVTLVAMVSTSANAALRLLGLTLSEWPPLFAGLLPITILAAIGADHVLTAPRARRGRIAAFSAIPFLVAALNVPRAEIDVVHGRLALAAVLVVGTLAAAWRPYRSLVLGLLVLAIATGGRTFQRWQPREVIATDSALARELRRRTSDGSRFAWIGARPAGDRFLLPNQETVLGLASVHTYDHLMSALYLEWARALGPVGQRDLGYTRRLSSLGRHALAARRDLGLAGVSTVVSQAPFRSYFVVDEVQVGDVVVGTLRQPPVLEALVEAGEWKSAEPGEGFVVPEALRPGTPVRRVRTAASDRLVFEFEPVDEERLLFISQAYRPAWRARILESGTLPLTGESRPTMLDTAPINALYQGVLVPPGVAAVELSFAPWIRWSWLPQFGFAVAALIALVASRGSAAAPGTS